MVKDYKVKFVSELAERIKLAGSKGTGKTLALANIGRLPSRQVQEVRKSLRGTTTVQSIKRSLLKRALEEAGVELGEFIADKPLLIISDLDAFELFRIIKSQRGMVAAKPGMISPIEVIVKEGGTGLPPGPAIGDLQNAGIPSKIEKGQIKVIKDHVILKVGDKVTPVIANALGKLDMKPFELGLEVEAIVEDGMVFRKEILDVDLDELIAKFGTAAAHALSLAHEIAHPVKEVIEALMNKINGQATSLALNIDWVSKDTVKCVLSKANAQAVSLNNISRKGGETGGI
ncbi:MAG: 50S ribosomal protein L10 [Candidatus Altiarchaeota archaeon]|nr:50S ribosomal protein L10 [Candidatus Altiarchaeota archaeon]